MPRIEPRDAWERVTAARHGVWGSVTPDARPHLVPVVFAVAERSVAWAVDDKPKSTRDLARLRNLAANPRASLLVDRYDDDWSRLWWVRADGTARIAAEDEAVVWIERLAARYPAYRARPPQGPVVVLEVERIVGWSAV